MLTPEKAAAKSRKFIGFVEKTRRDLFQPIPEDGIFQDGKDVIPEFNDTFVTDAWNRMAAPYLNHESIDAFVITMQMILENLPPIRGTQKWAGFGCGPALYERFMVKEFPDLEIACLDLSPTMVSIAEQVRGNSYDMCRRRQSE